MKGNLFQNLLILFLVLNISCKKDKDNGNNTTVIKKLENLEVINSESMYFDELYFLNDQIGYSIKNRGRSEIKKTIDGGKTWAMLSEDYDIGFGMDFYDEDRGVLTGFWTTKNTPPYESAQGPIITRNGGKSWEILLIDTTNLTYYSDCAWPKENEIFVCYGSGILRSKDNGFSWDTVSKIVDSSWRLNISFPTKDIGYVISYYSLYKSIDGGNTWTFASKPSFSSSSQIGPFTTDLKFINETNGFVVTSDDLYVTVDGGATWTSPQFIGSQKGDHSVYRGQYGNENTLFFIGEQGVYKSLDAGLTYILINELIDDKISYRPSSFFMLDDKNGVLSAYYNYATGDILQTNSIFVKTTTGWE